MRALLLFTILVSTTLSAQTTFAPLGAHWTYTYAVDNLIDPFPPVYSAYTLAVTGDSLIGGRLCSTIEGTSLACHTQQGFTYQSADSVFYWDEVANSFSLLYRWDATTGESWQIHSTGQGGTDTLTYTVQATGTVLINGQLLRTLEVTLWDQMALSFTSGRLIEGVGDTGYLFPWYTALCDGFLMGPLLCYEDGVLGLYLNPPATSCTIGTGIPEPSANGIPNNLPTLVDAGSPITLRVPASTNVEVIDAAGRVIGSLRTSSTQSMLTFPHAGMFVVRCMAEGHLLSSQRLIVR